MATVNLESDYAAVAEMRRRLQGGLPARPGLPWGYYIEMKCTPWHTMRNGTRCRRIMRREDAKQESSFQES